MSIKLAKKVGFCFGVRRAVEMAEDVLRRGKRVYSLGSIIHNAQVVKNLSARGLKVIEKIDDAKGGYIVISSHGISPHLADKILKRSLKLVDTTCPFVSKAQKKARSLNEAGYRIVIVGDANHPEVRALVDFARFTRGIRRPQTKANFAGNEVFVVKDSNDVKALKFKPNYRIGILSQTTQSMDNFLGVVKAIIESRPKDLRVFNTICKDAEERQAAARNLAREVDVMLIVGGRNSANTKRLLEVTKKILDKSYLVETQSDLRDSWFKKADAIGITSGASTPDWIVRQVVKEVQNKLEKKSVLNTGTRKEGCKR